MNDGLAGFPGFGGLNGMNVNISEEDLEKLLKMPNVRMVTSDDFNREIPKNQKLKKKKKTEEKEIGFYPRKIQNFSIHIQIVCNQ